MLALLTECWAFGQESPAGFFLEPDAPIEAAAAVAPAATAYSHVRFGRLNPAVAGLMNTLPASAPLRISVDLFSNEQHIIVIDRGEKSEANRVVCYGYIEGEPDSQVILALSQGALAGSIFLPGRGSFQIQYAGDGWQRLGQFDSDRMPPCGVSDRAGSWLGWWPTAAMAAVPSGADEAVSEASNPSLSLSNAVIDLLVVYTPAARVGAGGTDGMNALIDAAVAEANSAFANSQVSARLQLVCRAEIDYPETGDINQDLDYLEEDDRETTTDAGPIRGVHQLRRQYRADVVCLITEATGGPLGLANVMHQPDVDFCEEAFSVVQRQFANAYYVLAHEIGHNLGCQHDRVTSPSGGCFDYSHAYLFLVRGLRYHTIMSYQPGLPIPYFSNPDVLFSGVPTGVPEGATNSANNARTMNLTAPTAAQFSSYLLPGTPPQIVLIAPTNGASFTPGNISLSAMATGDEQPVEVSFLVDDGEIGQLEEPPFTFTWTDAALGLHTVRAVARDSVGWETATPAVTVTVSILLPMLDASASRPMGDGAFSLRARGPDGQTFQVEVSPDLITWVPVLTNSFSNECFDFIDPGASNYPARFYRIEPVP